jgi:ABC-2 type transport system permease protein
MKFGFLRLVWWQMVVQLRVRTLRWYSLGLLILQPVTFSAVGMLLARGAGNHAPDLVYIVIGGGILGMWSGLVFTSTFDIVRDRRDGMLEHIVGSPTSLATVEAIRTLTNVITGLVSMTVAILAALLIFHYSLARINLLGAAVSLLLLLFGMWCIGIFLANFLAWSRLSTTLVDFLEAPVAVLCGFMYPARILPGWMQAISGVVPLRWAIDALDASLIGSQDQDFLLLHWGVALGLSLVFGLLALWLNGKVHDHIRLTGELNSI